MNNTLEVKNQSTIAQEAAQPDTTNQEIKGMTAIGIRPVEENGKQEWELLRLTILGSKIQRVERVGMDENKFQVLLKAIETIGGVM